MRIFLLAISFPPCSYSSTTAWLSLPCITVLSRRPIRGHGPWQLPHRPVSNLPLHPLCRHLLHYILILEKTQYLFWNFFRFFWTFFCAALFSQLLKNLSDIWLFPALYRPFSSPDVYPRNRAYHLTIPCTPRHAYHVLPNTKFHHFQPHIRPVFRHFAQHIPFHSGLVYWYTSLLVYHFSALKRFGAFPKTSDVCPIFFSSVLRLTWEFCALRLVLPHCIYI